LLIFIFMNLAFVFQFSILASHSSAAIALLSKANKRVLMLAERQHQQNAEIILPGLIAVKPYCHQAFLLPASLYLKWYRVIADAEEYNPAKHLIPL